MDNKAIAFTGTREGMTPKQLGLTQDMLLWAWKQGYRYFHHGDCMGADSQAHDLAREIGFRIYIHPCNLSNQRAFRKADFEYSVKNPLDRNKDIVNDCRALIATPKTRTEEVRSGTWATIRYARGMKKILYLIHP